MAGMNLLGAAAVVGGIDEMIDMFSGGSDGYRVATNVEYAAHQEFGTARQDGTAHFRPGMDATKAKMAQLATQASDLDEFLKLTALQWESETSSRAPVDTGNLKASWTAEPL